MGVITNVSDFSNITGFYEMVVFADKGMEGQLGMMFVLSLFFIIMMALYFKKGSEFGDCVIAASFVCFFISLLLKYFQMVSFLLVIVFATIMILGALLKYAMKQKVV